MRTTELFRTCANEYVAAAALACIGGRLERRVAAAAHRADLSVGAVCGAAGGGLRSHGESPSPRASRNGHAPTRHAAARRPAPCRRDGAGGSLGWRARRRRWLRPDPGLARSARRFVAFHLERPAPRRVARALARAEKSFWLRFLGRQGRRIFFAGASGNETTGGKPFVPIQARLRKGLAATGGVSDGAYLGSIGVDAARFSPFATLTSDAGRAGGRSIRLGPTGSQRFRPINRRWRCFSPGRGENRRSRKRACLSRR